ncbi:UPF0061-domain-containing protein, partial [Violaceomyces palustris]
MSSSSPPLSSVPLKRYPLHRLPLVNLDQRLTSNLLPDPITPSSLSILSNSNSSPSYLRRSRPVLQGSHFTYVTPLTLPFPYELPRPPPSVKEGGEEQEQEGSNKSDSESGGGAREIEEALGWYEIPTPPLPFRPSYQTDQGVSSEGQDLEDGDQGLQLYLPEGRKRNQLSSFPSSRLLAVSRKALKDCLPHLDVGDSFEWIRSKNRLVGGDLGVGSETTTTTTTFSSGPSLDSTSIATRDGVTRRLLSDVLSGRVIMARFPNLAQDSTSDLKVGVGVEYFDYRRKVSEGKIPPEEETDRRRRRNLELERSLEVGGGGVDHGYAPWSLCYAGHQFGSWAGQLGDGRAVTLMETFNPETGERWEIQLKGAGRTPYSRFADGLAVLASSVREYLASEAMAALKIPTSRALAIVSLPELKVLRERIKTAAITTRLCQSWLRIGSFQIHSSRREWESLRILGEYVCHDLLGWEEVVKAGGGGGRRASRSEQGRSTTSPPPPPPSPPWAKRLVEEVGRRNARTIALWQVYGFMHGVMNTDNISILGHTIDYGPFAFMDLFDQGQICNHSDSEGRYAYRLQPTMGVFAIRELFESLSTLIGFELENSRAPLPDELAGLEDQEASALSQRAKSELYEHVEKVFTETLKSEWIRAWRYRLGLETCKEDDREEIVDPLLDVLEDLDFSITLRNLCSFPTFLESHHPKEEEEEEEEEESIRTKVKDFLSQSRLYSDKDLADHVRQIKRNKAETWLRTYAKRLKEENLQTLSQLELKLKSRNPRFTLRNWVTDEVVEKLERENDTDLLELVSEV